MIAERDNGDSESRNSPFSRNTTQMERNASKNNSCNNSEIDKQVYKYQTNKGPSTEATPKIQQGHLRGTATSFNMSRPPPFTELRKAEAMNQNMPLILKQTKPIDQVVMLLQMIKNVLKPNKITLFMLDDSLIQRIFSYQKDRKHNYKTIQMGQSFIQAIFVTAEDFQMPCFKDLDEVNQIFSGKILGIPLSDTLSNAKCP
jgi:hypothetical protein